MRWISIFILTASCLAIAPHRDTRVFKPSPDAAARQDAAIEAHALPRIKNNKELKARIAAGELVALTPQPGLAIDHRLPRERRYVRPETLTVIEWLAEEYIAHFGTPLTVTSAVRPETVQRRLRRWNRNAAPAKESSHTTGATVDISRREMTQEETIFIEDLMMPLVVNDRAVVLEERGQMCFHIFVIPWGDQ